MDLFKCNVLLSALIQSPFYLETIHCIIFRSWMVCAEGTTNILIPFRPEKIVQYMPWIHTGWSVTLRRTESALFLASNKKRSILTQLT